MEKSGRGVELHLKECLALVLGFFIVSKPEDDLIWIFTLGNHLCVTGKGFITISRGVLSASQPKNHRAFGQNVLSDQSNQR